MELERATRPATVTCDEEPDAIRRVLFPDDPVASPADALEADLLRLVQCSQEEPFLRRSPPADDIPLRAVDGHLAHDWSLAPQTVGGHHALLG